MHDAGLVQVEQRRQIFHTIGRGRVRLEDKGSNKHLSFLNTGRYLLTHASSKQARIKQMKAIQDQRVWIMDNGLYFSSVSTVCKRLRSNNDTNKWIFQMFYQIRCCKGVNWGQAKGSTHSDVPTRLRLWPCDPPSQHRPHPLPKSSHRVPDGFSPSPLECCPPPTSAGWLQKHRKLRPCWEAPQLIGFFVCKKCIFSWG